MSQDTCNTAGAESCHVSRTGSPGIRHHPTQEQRRCKGKLEGRNIAPRASKTRSGKVGLREARPAKTVRAGPSDVDRLRLINADA
ncbi:MAG: hypothetical protein ACYDEY_10420 [Acidimicrobiales bacterium]